MVDLRDEPRTATPASGVTLGLPQAITLIVGSIIWVSIFNLPYFLASIGPIGLVAMILIGLFSISTADVRTRNVSRSSNVSAPGSARATCLFSVPRAGITAAVQYEFPALGRTRGFVRRSRPARLLDPVHPVLPERVPRIPVHLSL